MTGDLAAYLAPHYTMFRVSERLLLTGHSHQAWPDVALDGQLEAFHDAALGVDAKWGRAMDKAEEVRAGFRRVLDDPAADLALGSSTHELVIRFLSSLPLGDRPRLVTSDGEFHTLRRQLDRLAEEGLEVVRVPAEPAGSLSARLAEAVDDRTAAVLVSAVMYETAAIVPELEALADACDRRGAQLLVDAYHALGVVPFSAAAIPSAWVVGGGYKYLQLGEGNCFLRVPPHAARFRPVITGWFAEFADLAAETGPDAVAYPPGAQAFSGATYDPTSHYRAARVFGFFAEHGLTPDLLRLVSQRQLARLCARFDAMDTGGLISRDTGTPLAGVAGFLALRSPHAARLRDGLTARGVLADSRGHMLRLGPAPYLSDDQLDAAMDALEAELAAMRANRPIPRISGAA
ncbi:aminotransferase class V-fold PLP-dependent enzyme [Sphaerisporangium album]|uniref:Aminotransferase class V-fold PLP-dependent enzyme n=1 Tax=Sphaerisporangium album TaxID=509200 RepID=A0A367FN96_9ACTN|nr:aminotransferase class V-fold PLP-dependent enzyme [Sphaerisporangium album]RCG31197.1 aminotransferase class V-fold PLP-dependent enzyme [Sphaerisporangium album]